MAEGNGADRHAGVDRIVDTIRDAPREIATPSDERRMIYAKGENLRHVRHGEILERWPVLWDLRRKTGTSYNTTNAESEEQPSAICGTLGKTTFDNNYCKDFGWRIK